jgi:serine/threonine protein phosphatase PrpC
MNVHSVSLKGRRVNNEDKHNIILNEDGHIPEYANVNYLGIYDGHGGKYVSKYLSDNLPILFMDKLVKYPLKRNYILDSFKNINDQLETNHKNYTTHCGSTCLVVIHYKSLKDGQYYINLMNTGDSRCIICRDNLGIPLSKDHKPHWPEERHRIQQLGGKIYYDGDDYRIKDLSVSRAFGDFAASPYVTYVPDIYRYRLEKNDKFIVLACDGLWDRLSNQEVVNFILTECYDSSTTTRINKNVNIAKKLGEYAIQRGSNDNVTIIIIFFDGDMTNNNQ